MWGFWEAPLNDKDSLWEEKNSSVRWRIIAMTKCCARKITCYTLRALTAVMSVNLNRKEIMMNKSLLLLPGGLNTLFHCCWMSSCLQAKEDGFPSVYKHHCSSQGHTNHKQVWMLSGWIWIDTSWQHDLYSESMSHCFPE